MSVRPKLAFVSIWDAADPNAESGYGYSIRQQLRARFEVVDVFPLALPFQRSFLPLRAAYRAMGQYYHPMREPSVLQALARAIDARLEAIAPDVLVAPSSLPLTFVDSTRPVVYITDQLFCSFVDTYIGNAAARFRRLGHAQEARALARATRVSYPSDIVARDAVEFYGAAPAKIDVIPWGANLPRALSNDEVDAGIASRPSDRCDLVFLGKDWQRKGGDKLVETVSLLNSSGLPTRATIIGASPRGLPPEIFDIHPFLDKAQPQHFALFAKIMARAHFLFLPSRAEAFAQAFCEAAAFGVPAIGSTAGSLTALIKEGETGFARPADSPARVFADIIRGALDDPSAYHRLARNARLDHLDRLNWDRFGARLAATIEAVA